MSYVDDEDDKDYMLDEEERVELRVEETAKKRTQRGKGRGRGRGRRKKIEEDEDEDVDDPSVGEVFALEMELNRENKKMMKVRRRREECVGVLFWIEMFVSF